MLDIVMLLAEKARNDPQYLANTKKAKDELLKEGYGPDEAEHGIRWTASKLKLPSSKSIRVLSPYERLQLTTDGCGLLLKLRNLGLLTDEHLELIIARSILLGEGPIDADGIRAMATVFLFDLKNQESGFSIYIDSDGGDIEN